MDNNSSFTYTIDDDCEYDAFLFFIITYPSSGNAATSQHILITKDTILTMSSGSSRTLGIDGTAFNLTLVGSSSIKKPEISLSSISGSGTRYRWLYGIKF